MPAQKVEIEEGNTHDDKSILIRIYLDLADTLVEQKTLDELIDGNERSALWTLNLLTQIKKNNLPKILQDEWQGITPGLVRELMSKLFSADVAHSAEVSLGGESIRAGTVSLLGHIAFKLLSRRYPDYHTLIRQPGWRGKVDDYINALSSNEVPLSCKRGRESWQPTNDQAARILRANRMNLNSAYVGYERLITINSKGKKEPLEIKLFVHPLEKKITELICQQPHSSESMLEINGSACLFLYQSKLLQIFEGEGYTPEEIKKILEIGSNRGSFYVGKRRGQEVVFCKPIDPKQMRTQLLAKLADLEKEIELFRQLPELSFSFDVDKITKRIENLQDEVDYQKIQLELQSGLKQLHGSLPTHFKNLSSDLDLAKNIVRRLQQQLSGSHDANTLRVPAGKSKWRDSLERYEASNLKEMIDDFKFDVSSQIDYLGRQSLRFVYQETKPPSQNLTLLFEGYSALADAKDSEKKLKSDVDDLMIKLRDYQEWLKLLVRSDQVYGEILNLWNQKIHRIAATSLLKIFDALCQEITEHLELRNVQGLTAHKQFATRLDDIDKRRVEYWQGLKSEFDKRKERVNSLLDSFKIDRRVKMIFNPGDENCYTEMFGQAASYICEAGNNRALIEIETQQREMTYARDILQSIEEIEVKPLLDRLSAARDNLISLSSLITGEWVHKITKEENNLVETQVKESLDEGFVAARQARQALSTHTAANPPADGSARSMYDLIAEKGTLDLKEIILQMMLGMDRPSEALDESLICLADLFRRNCVQIKVDKRRE